MLEKILRLLRAESLHPAEGFAITLDTTSGYLVFLRDDVVSPFDLLRVAKKVPSCTWHDTAFVSGKELVRLRKQLKHSVPRPTAILFVMEE